MVFVIHWHELAMNLHVFPIYKFFFRWILMFCFQLLGKHHQNQSEPSITWPYFSYFHFSQTSIIVEPFLLYLPYGFFFFLWVFGILFSVQVALLTVKLSVICLRSFSQYLAVWRVWALESDSPGLEFQLCYLLAVWLGMSHIPSLHISFLVKMRLTVSSLQGSQLNHS